MKFYIVIPAYNEEGYIERCLESLIHQTLLPKKLVIVNDNSTDNTAKIIAQYTAKYDWIESLTTGVKAAHKPGKKVVNTFYKGFETLDEDYDIICKFDADLIFPNKYLETLARYYESESIGMAAGYCYIEKGNDWILEPGTGKLHIRGALKSYRKACFEKIGGLKPSMGWDTVDELLVQYHGWKLALDASLVVKHLRPTGKSYKKSARFLQGEAFYKMRYGIILTFIATLKMALKKKNARFFFNTIRGYLRASYLGLDRIVTKKEGGFIRSYRWKNILKKIF